MRLDIFLPKKLLAFEYQGEQHYYDIYSFGPQWTYSIRDEEKRIICKEKGITVIEIPYWWDYKLNSLLTAIHKYRPDLIPNPGNGEAIPEQPPTIRGNFF